MKMNEMLYALTDFCIEQDDNETADEDTIAAMIGGLLEYCDRRLPHFDIAADRICRYRFLNCGVDEKRILPRNVKNNDVLCENGIVLCHITRKNLPIGKKDGSCGLRGGLRLRRECYPSFLQGNVPRGGGHYNLQNGSCLL